MKKYFLFAITLSLIAISCTNNKAELVLPDNDICEITPATFASDIQPLIQSKCAIAGCHAAGSAAGGTVLETYAQINAKITRINQRALIEKTMPPTNKASSGAQHQR